MQTTMVILDTKWKYDIICESAFTLCLEAQIWADYIFHLVGIANKNLLQVLKSVIS